MANTKDPWEEDHSTATKTCTAKAHEEEEVMVNQVPTEAVCKTKVHLVDQEVLTET